MCGSGYYLVKRLDGYSRERRGSNMSDQVLLNLLDGFGDVIKCEACRTFYHFFATSLINSMIVRFHLSYDFLVFL